MCVRSVTRWVLAKVWVSSARNLSARTSSTARRPAAGPSGEVLASWRGAGLDEGETRTWWALGLRCLEEVQAWRTAGFTAQQANFILDVLAARMAFEVDSAAGIHTSAPADWRDSGLPPWWVCLCVSAGVQQVADGAALHVQHQCGSDDVEVLGEIAIAGRRLDPWRLRALARDAPQRGDGRGRRDGRALSARTASRGR